MKSEKRMQGHSGLVPKRMDKIFGVLFVLAFLGQGLLGGAMVMKSQVDTFKSEERALAQSDHLLGVSGDLVDDAVRQKLQQKQNTESKKIQEGTRPLWIAGIAVAFMGLLNLLGGVLVFFGRGNKWLLMGLCALSILSLLVSVIRHPEFRLWAIPFVMMLCYLSASLQIRKNSL
jgi:hypothetical protein